MPTSSPDLLCRLVVDRVRIAALLCASLGMSGALQAAVPATTVQAPAPAAVSSAAAAGVVVPYRLRIVGGLAGISQYTRQEKPF